MPRKDPESRKAYKAAYYAKHREELKKKQALYNATHREHIKAHKAAYYAAHREERKQADAEHYATHKEEHKAYRQAHRTQIQAYNAAWYLAHSEERKRYNAEWLEKNKDKRKEYKRNYLLTKPEIGRAAAHRYRARKYGAPVNDFTIAQWESMKQQYQYRCVYCGKKPKLLTQDHIIPLSKGGLHTWNNIVPACKSCNSRKFTGTILVPIQSLLFDPIQLGTNPQQKQR